MINLGTRHRIRKKPEALDVLPEQHSQDGIGAHHADPASGAGMEKERALGTDAECELRPRGLNQVDSGNVWESLHLAGCDVQGTRLQRYLELLSWLDKPCGWTMLGSDGKAVGEGGFKCRSKVSKFADRVLGDGWRGARGKSGGPVGGSMGCSLVLSEKRGSDLSEQCQ